MPHGKALRATKDNIAQFEAQKKVLEANNAKRKAEAEAVAKKMDSLHVVIVRQASEGGHLYGSVTSRDIADAVAATGMKVERSQVVVNQAFKTIGLFQVPVALHPEVKVDVTVNIARSEEEAKTQNLEWLDQFGTLGTFLKNDIKLITRNKRAKTVIIMSVLFLFYGLLFMTGSVKAYDGPIWTIFGGIFVSGGFLFSFGQFVPSWDSSYYKLMMSQNIQYREYISSKWWLMVIVTLISTLLASFYLFFGWKVYLAVLAAAVYNIGINAYIVLLAGAYTKTPIDLMSNRNAFGDKKAFNIKTLLLIIPQLVIPLALYFAGITWFSDLIGFAFVALAGIAGFALRNKAFDLIEKIYKAKKYETIAAYNQKN